MTLVSGTSLGSYEITGPIGAGGMGEARLRRAWGGWRLLDQQSLLDEQRARDRAESAADAVSAGVRGKLAEAGERLSARCGVTRRGTCRLKAIVCSARARSNRRIAKRAAGFAKALELFIENAREVRMVDEVKLPSAASAAIRAYATLRKTADEEGRAAPCSSTAVATLSVATPDTANGCGPPT